MKKMRYVITVLALLLALTGCTRHPSSETDMTPQEIISAIAESQPEFPQFRQVTSEDEYFSTYLSSYYMIEPEQVQEGIIRYAEGAEVSEVGVLVLAESADTENVRNALTEYIKKRAGVFEGYAPQQVALAQKGRAVVNGGYVALLICPDTPTAETAFLNCFGEKEKISSITGNAAETADQEAGTEQSEEDALGKTKDVYDSAAVLQAWKSGDDTCLSEINLAIFKAAKEVIRQEITDDMSDYEKELAIHDWITGWSSFDYGVFGRSAEEGFDEGSDTPYGVLIDQKAMCHGYSSTFQLFMDMLGIECITVFGTPGSNGVEHSWNMVRLDGEWYCVDAAWDDPIGGSPGHRFFNVTSEYLRKSGIHHWDESSVPEASAVTYAFEG